MPIATPAQLRQMLDTAQQNAYAYPAINVTSIITLNAAMKGFADSKSDGIIQFSTGAGQLEAVAPQQILTDHYKAMSAAQSLKQAKRYVHRGKNPI